ncbi:MAG: LemA family protein [Bacteroidales bacterium]|nr:LemA family protein [Bacteroidales bacterium]MCB9013418.1 LemA family protein [Bacteroidales bacterium]
MKNIIKILAVVMFIPFLQSCGYNKLVTQDEAINQAWAQVENAYQRRADLIPNLVETVKGYANFEKSTLTDVIEARANATKVTVDPANLSPEAIQNFQEAQNGLSSSLARLMVVVERYPDLKANQNFLELQSQLEGTENRISFERKKFNDTVGQYNAARRVFPRNIIAGIFGFKERGYFKADEGSEKAPAVKF